jgi:hypothetical protein
MHTFFGANRRRFVLSGRRGSGTTANDVPKSTFSRNENNQRNPVDRTQYYALLAYVRSIRRLLIYILATLFGVLCFAIVEFEHPPLVWVLLYPVIFIFIVMVEIRMSKKKQRELDQEDLTPPSEPPVKRGRKKSDSLKSKL